ncbi:MAG: BsuPI-related putative proteinase inhibitor [Chthoniobacterales bacterium]
MPCLLVLALAASALAQETEATPRRGWMSRLLHPFRSEGLPQYKKNPELQGLVVSLELSPQPVKLSEIRQLEVRFSLTNRSKHPITLQFPTTQRFEINLRNATSALLTTWSDNHAFTDEPATVFINPQEHVDYADTIATRDLAPNKVFTVEVFFPSYPELRVRQKFLTAP